MKPPPFTLHRPATVDDAVKLLVEIGEDALVLAGGQSLVPMMALRVAAPPDLIDINKIGELDRIAVDGSDLAIGALIRHARFHRPVETGVLGNLLATVVRHVAHYPIRQRGTFCGSLAHADPASEWCLVAATLDAKLKLAGGAGSRTLSFDEFVEGALTTARKPDELLVEARLPLLGEDARFGFYEFNRRAGDFALGMALAVYRLKDGVMSDVRIGIGGIEEKARRITAAETLLDGERPGPDAFAAAARAVREDVDAMEDATTSSDYRRELSGTVVRRALEASVAGQEIST